MPSDYQKKRMAKKKENAKKGKKGGAGADAEVDKKPEEVTNGASTNGVEENGTANGNSDPKILTEEGKPFFAWFFGPETARASRTLCLAILHRPCSIFSACYINLDSPIHVLPK